MGRPANLKEAHADRIKYDEQIVRLTNLLGPQLGLNVERLNRDFASIYALDLHYMILELICDRIEEYRERARQYGTPTTTKK